LGRKPFGVERGSNPHHTIGNGDIPLKNRRGVEYERVYRHSVMGCWEQLAVSDMAQIHENYEKAWEL